MSAYGPDHAAAMAGAFRQWEDLGLTLRRALLDATEKGGPITRALVGTPKAACEALIGRGLAVKMGGPFTWLTPMGLLVREAGVDDGARVSAEALNRAGWPSP